MKFFVAASSKDLPTARQQTEQSGERDNFFMKIHFSSKEDLKKEIVFTPFPNNRSPMEIHAGMLWKARSCNWNIGKDLRNKSLKFIAFLLTFPQTKKNFAKAWKRDREKCQLDGASVPSYNWRTLRTLKYRFLLLHSLLANCTIHITNLCSLVCRPLLASIEKCLKDKRLLRSACTCFGLSSSLLQLICTNFHSSFAYETSQPIKWNAQY